MSEDALLARIARLEREVERLARRRSTPIGYGVSTLGPDDTGSVQSVQAQFDALSVRDAIPVLYHYGFSACPPVGADKLVAYLEGDRSKAVIVATNHQEYRWRNLAPGEMVISDLTRGRSILLGEAGITINAGGAAITVTGASTLAVTSSGPVTIHAPTVTVSGNMTVQGALGVTGDVTAANIEG